MVASYIKFPNRWCRLLVELTACQCKASHPRSNAHAAGGSVGKQAYRRLSSAKVSHHETISQGRHELRDLDKDCLLAGSTRGDEGDI